MKAVIIALAICAIAAASASYFTPGEEEFISTDAGDLHRPARGCKLKCNPRSCSVTIYKHCNYRGHSINLKPGSYNMHQLKRKGMRNDDISSIKFHGRCHAKLYEHWKFTGKSKTWKRNDSCFTRTRMKMESLLQISEAPEETELVQTQFGRWRRERPHWGRRRRVSWNDQMSSMKVFNKAGRICHFDCSERNAKMKEKSKKAAIRRKKAVEKAKKAAAREKADKAHKKKVAEKKRKADVRKEKAAKKRVERAKKYWARIQAWKERNRKRAAAWRKRVAARKEKRTKKAKAAEKKRKIRAKKRAAMRKKRAAMRKKRAAMREKRMKAQFKKKEKKLKKCEVPLKHGDTKGNRIKGMCRAYARFCRLYKEYGLHDDAQRHCVLMMKFHKQLLHRHHKH